LRFVLHNDETISQEEFPASEMWGIIINTVDKLSTQCPQRGNRVPALGIQIKALPKTLLPPLGG